MMLSPPTEMDCLHPLVSTRSSLNKYTILQMSPQMGMPFISSYLAPQKNQPSFATLMATNDKHICAGLFLDTCPNTPQRPIRKCMDSCDI